MDYHDDTQASKTARERSVRIVREALGDGAIDVLIAVGMSPYVMRERLRCAAIAITTGYEIHDRAPDPQGDDSDRAGEEIARRILAGR